MSITAVELFIAITATWRLASMFANEEGPFRIFERLRRYAVRLETKNRLFARSRLAKGLMCEWCNSVWVASVITLFWFLRGHGIIWALLPFTLSAGTIFMKYITQALENFIILTKRQQEYSSLFYKEPVDHPERN